MMDQWWPMPWFPMFPIFFLLICLIVLVFVIVPMMRDRRPDRDYGSQRNALNILNERFARGEISREEYLEKKRSITAS